MALASLNGILILQYNTEVLLSDVAKYLSYMPEKVTLDVSTVVMAPMPGLVKSIAVKEGQPVSFILRC